MARPSLLDQTGNLIALYLHAAGKSEVPPEFHYWACLSLLAATVGDRVSVEKFRDSRLAPNMYVLLLGPSGLGKGTAIDVAARYTDKVPRINFFRGKATAQYLVDYMGGAHKTGDGKWVIENTKLYLCTPELAMSVGRGDAADDFIKFMTEVYTGGSYPLRVGTRTRGLVEVRNPTINWIGGSTIQWLRDCIPQDAIEGGFFARTFCIGAAYDLNKRFRRPEYPHDYDVIVDHIRARIYTLAHLEGTFELTPDAERLETIWYETREAPQDERLIPTWKRAHDALLKVAMLLSLADTDDLVITADHINRARLTVERALTIVPTIIDYARQTRETGAFLEIAKLIKDAGAGLLHSTLLRRVGLDAEAFKVALDTLKQRGQIAELRTVRGARAYTWIGRRQMPIDETEEQA